MPQAIVFLKPFISAPSSAIWSNSSSGSNFMDANVIVCKRLEVVCHGRLAPRKFMQKRKKMEVFKDPEDEADQKNWRRLMKEIEDEGSAVTVLQRQRPKNKALPKDLVIGTLVRFKQLKKWNLVGEVLEWLRTQHWWDFSEMDFLMLITAYGKQGDFAKAETILSYMNKQEGRRLGFRGKTVCGPRPKRQVHWPIFILLLPCLLSIEMSSQPTYCWMNAAKISDFGASRLVPLDQTQV